MRLLSAIIAGGVIAFALPATSHADGMPPTAAKPAPVANCPCLRPHRVVHHWRHVARRPIGVPPPYWPANYNPLLPSPLDSAYDRAMTLHFRSPPVSGEYPADPGYAPLPPVAGVAAYRVPAYAGVYQYDGLTGEYVRLAQWDAQRTGMLPPPPPPPPPAAAPH
ncbi:MAG TPA: hypothetical protein VKQ73_14690 [Stellaceae bacterium]|nr:hypothetical protein [Stellaceae bacterium]